MKKSKFTHLLYRTKSRRYAGVAALLMAAASVLTGCQQTAQKDFDAFVNNDFVTTMQGDWLTAHTYLQNPENYGINMAEAPISFGEVMTDEDYELNTQDLAQTRKEFDKIHRNLLTDAQKDTYDAMAYILKTSELYSDEAFRKFDFSFATFSGGALQIPTMLADLQLRNADDVEALLTLLDMLHDSMDEWLEVLNTQVDDGTLILDCDGVIETAQQYVDAGEDGSTLMSILENISEADGLTEEEIKDYQAQAKNAYMDSFVPAYEDVVQTVTELKDVKQPEGGLASVDDGKEYYEVLVRDALGSSKSVDEIRDMLISQYNKQIERIQALMQDENNSQVILQWMNDEIKTDYTDYKTPLTDLFTEIKADFPEIAEVNYEIQSLPEDMENGTIAAYYNIPALDSTWPQTIFVNTMADSLDIGSLDTFTTLAHEGFPGHMYATNYIYNQSDISDWVKTIGNNSGFTEGYAAYVELFALKYLDDIDEAAIEMQQAMTILQDTFLALMDIGVHYEGWTLEDMAQTMDDYGMDSSYADYYFNMIRANPTSLLSYYAGRAEILELKEKAQRALGDHFSDMEFHKALLKSGNTIFDVVERNIDEYIASASNK